MSGTVGRGETPLPASGLVLIPADDLIHRSETDSAGCADVAAHVQAGAGIGATGPHNIGRD